MNRFTFAQTAKPRVVVISFVLINLLCSTAYSAPLTEGNILTSWGRIYEYTTSGTYVQTIDVSSAEGIRDIIVTPTGNIAVYNGTFQPFLSIYDPLYGTWQHTQFSGWSTINNVSYGGIAAFQNFVYVTDMSTSGSGSPAGIVRFNTTDNSAERFAENQNFIDLTIGLDGFLYAAAGSNISVYDPITFSLVRTFGLQAECRGIAVNSAGKIFSSSWDGRIYRYDSDGRIEKSINGGVGSLMDIDISSSGTLLVSGRFGDVLITDEALEAVSVLAGVRGEFVAFISPLVPEPMLTGLEIVGPNEVPDNNIAGFNAIAYYDDNSTKDVTQSAQWMVDNNEIAQIDANGILTTNELLTVEEETVISASYSEDDVNVSAQKLVVVYADCTIAELVGRNIDSAVAIKKEIIQNLHKALEQERRAKKLLSEFKDDPSFENWSFRDFVNAMHNLNWAIFDEHLSTCYIRASIMYLRRIDPERENVPPVPGPRTNEIRQKK
jgi:hypothetical protein